MFIEPNAVYVREPYSSRALFERLDANPGYDMTKLARFAISKYVAWKDYYKERGEE